MVHQYHVVKCLGYSTHSPCLRGRRRSEEGEGLRWVKLFSAPDAALVLNKLHTQRPWLGERGGKHQLRDAYHRGGQGGIRCRYISRGPSGPGHGMSFPIRFGLGNYRCSYGNHMRSPWNPDHHQNGTYSHRPMARPVVQRQACARAPCPAPRQVSRTGPTLPRQNERGTRKRQYVPAHALELEERCVDRGCACARAMNQPRRSNQVLPVSDNVTVYTRVLLYT